MAYENERKQWTEEDKNYLYDVWGELTIAKIAKQLKRSKESIISFTEKNGLGGFLYTGAYLTTGQASELIGVDYTTIIHWIKKGLLKAKFRKIHKKKVYLIDPADFKNFLKDNQDKWRFENLQNDIFNSDEEWLLDKKQKDKEDIYYKTGNAWTVMEEKALIGLINKGYTTNMIAKHLCRSKGSIERKRDALIAEGRIERNKKLIQDKIHKEFILSNWGKLSIKELAEHTNKTEEQVAEYKWKYNLPSLYTLEEDLFTFIELSKLLSVSRDTIRRWHNAFGLKAEENYKGNKKRLAVNINDLVSFVEDNKDKLSKATYEKCKLALEEHFNSKKREVA